MRLIRLLLLASLVVGCISLSEVASAQQASRWPNLNPFKKTNPAAGNPAEAGDAGGGLKLPFPKLPTLGGGAKSRPKRQPTAWQRFNQGSRNLWSKTATTLNPWSKPAAPQRKSATGTRRTYSGSSTASSRSTSERKPFYASWLQPAAPKPKRVESVNDWLRLPPVTLDDN